MVLMHWRRWLERRQPPAEPPADAEWNRVALLPEPHGAPQREHLYWLALQFLVAVRALAQPADDAWTSRCARAEAVQRAEQLAADLIHAATADLGPALRAVRRLAWEHLDGRTAANAAALAGMRDALVRDQGSDWDRLPKVRRRVVHLLATHGGCLTRQEMVGIDCELQARDRSRDATDNLDRHLDELLGAGFVERGGRDGAYRLVRLPAGTPRQVVDLWRARWTAG